MIEKLTKATWTDEQIKYSDYIFIELEVKKYETSVRPITMKEEQSILVITKEIFYDRNIEEHYLFMCSTFDQAFFSIVILSDEGEILKANKTSIEDFDLCGEQIFRHYLFQLPIIPEKAHGTIQKII